jgi:hypothetical protein
MHHFDGVKRGVHVARHPGHRARHDAVAFDTARGAFDRGDVVQAEKAALRHPVIGHAGHAVDTTGRQGEDDASVTCLAHVWKGRADDMEAAAQVDVNDRVEILLAELAERAPADVAGVVDQDVDAAEVIQRGFDNRLAALRGRYRLMAADSLAAGIADRLHHLFDRTGIAAVAIHAPTDIVDQHSGAACREQERVGTPHPPPRARDDGDPPVEA